MTRQECERKIAEKLHEIWDIAQEYSPKEKRRLNMSAGEDTVWCFRIVGETEDGQHNDYGIDVFEWKEDQNEEPILL